MAPAVWVIVGCCLFLHSAIVALDNAGRCSE